MSALDVAAVVRRARAAGRLGLDTEFVSEGRYRPLLCLLQVALPPPAEPEVLLLDPLDPAGLDPGPLAELLADPAVEVVLHAGRQDLLVLRAAWGVRVRGVFDTQLAAGFVGRGAQTGYAQLLEQLLGVRLAKTASFSRWDARPLTAEQLDYATDDVRHLLALADALEAGLAAAGRLEWAREECRRLEEVAEPTEPDTAWLRLPRVGQLRPRARAVARELAGWRERAAAAEDRPAGWVLGDVVLLETARRMPTSRTELAAIRGVSEATLRRRADPILAAVRRGKDAEPPPAPATEPAPGDRADAPLVALGEALGRARALEAGLAYELLATRAELDLVVRAAREGVAPPAVRLLQGWRRELVGAELVDLLAGHRLMGVGGGRIVVEPRAEES